MIIKDENKTNQIQKMLGDNERPYCMVGIPSWQGMLDPDMLACLNHLKYHNWAQGVLVGESHGTGSMIAVNRNKVIKEAIKNGAEYLLLVDTDMIFPPDSIQRLAAHDKPVVAGLAFSKMHNSVPNMYWRGDDGEWSPIVEWDDGTLVKVDCIGGAFILIKTEILKDLPAPWFASPTVADYYTMMAAETASAAGGDVRAVLESMKKKFAGNDNVMGEDFYFSELLRRNGIPIYVDTSLKIGHVGRYPFGYHNFKAAKEAGNLDHLIRNKVAGHDA